tara:strand:- start:370 stop:1431 length:1062 start_codon:yes stop_codon:yes gene_type:complete
MATDYTQTTRRAPFIEAAQENYVDLLTQQVGRAPGSVGVPTLSELGPQIAGQNVLTQQAQQQAATQAGLGQLTFDASGGVTGAGQGTGISGYEPYLDQASQYQTQAGTTLDGMGTTLGGVGTTLTGAQNFSGPTAYQQFMSPYQQDIIDTTLTDFDYQTAQGVPQLSANAINAGAFGGGRDGVAQAQYASDAARQRADLQAKLLGQGYTQANQFANQAFNQQTNLAQQQANLAQQQGNRAQGQLNLGDMSRQLASLQPSLVASSVQQLGAAGTGNLAYQQALLDAQQQQNQLAYNEPLNRIQSFGSGIASQASGSPITTTNQSMGGGAQSVGPLSQALSAGLSAYGLGSIFGA